MELPFEVKTLLANYENVVLIYKNLSEEIREELEGFYLLRDESQIIKENTDIRQGEANWTREINKWPNNYFVIGHDGCGNYYYLNLDDNTVGFYDHEEMTFSKETDSIQQYANEIAQFLENEV